MTMRKILPVFLIVGGGLLFAAMVGFLLISNAVENPGTAPLPEVIYGLSLSSYSTGKAASNEVNRMHNNNFLVTSASVGTYGRQQVTLWVTGSPAEFLADRMVVEMDEKIRNVQSPFTPIAQRQENNRNIFELDGLGQKHYYFQSGKLVIWVAAQTDIADIVLDQILDFYP
jgi:hypothetical protein